MLLDGGHFVFLLHRFLLKKLPMHPKTVGMGRINDIAIRYVAKLSGKGVSTVQ